MNFLSMSTKSVSVKDQTKTMGMWAGRLGITLSVVIRYKIKVCLFQFRDRSPHMTPAERLCLSLYFSAERYSTITFRNILEKSLANSRQQTPD